MKLTAKAIILDMDGTIVDSKNAYLDAAKIAFAETKTDRFNVAVALEIPKRFEIGVPLDDLLSGIDAKKFRETYLKAFYLATANKTKPLPFVAETLGRLRKKAQLALTTRRFVTKNEIIDQLNRFRLAGYFDFVLTAKETVNPKPSPEALIECSEKLGVEIHECAVVGDSIVDIIAGKRAEAKTVAVLSGLFSRNELAEEKPDLILKNVAKLPDFLE